MHNIWHLTETNKACDDKTKCLRYSPESFHPFVAKHAEQCAHSDPRSNSLPFKATAITHHPFANLSTGKARTSSQKTLQGVAHWVFTVQILRRVWRSASCMPPQKLWLRTGPVATLSKHVHQLMSGHSGSSPSSCSPTPPLFRGSCARSRPRWLRSRVSKRCRGSRRQASWHRPRSSACFPKAFVRVFSGRQQSGRPRRRCLRCGGSSSTGLRTTMGHHRYGVGVELGFQALPWESAPEGSRGAIKELPTRCSSIGLSTIGHRSSRGSLQALCLTWLLL